MTTEQIKIDWDKSEIERPQPNLDFSWLDLTDVTSGQINKLVYKICNQIYGEDTQEACHEALALTTGFWSVWERAWDATPDKMGHLAARDNASESRMKSFKDWANGLKQKQECAG
jgi:hypothetical protein